MCLFFFKKKVCVCWWCACVGVGFVVFACVVFWLSSLFDIARLLLFCFGVVVVCVVLCGVGFVLVLCWCCVWFGVVFVVLA